MPTVVLPSGTTFNPGTPPSPHAVTVFHRGTDKRYWVSQPQFTRHRHRFRGQRSSYKTNLEISQFGYDISRLFSRGDTLVINEIQNWDNIEGGATIAAGFYWAEAATPTLTAVVLPGFAEIVSRVQALLNRVRSVESS